MAYNTPTFRKSTGSVAMTATYNTIVYDYFPLVSIPNRPIYWDARYSMEWASGKVGYEHNKLLSSGIGMTLVEMMNKRILGGELVFKTNNNKKKAKETVDFIRDVCDTLDLNGATEIVDTKGLAGGSAYYVLSPDGDGLRLDAIGLDQAFVSFKGNKPHRAKLFINYIDDNSTTSGGRYFLIEERYFNKAGTPCTINKIYKSMIPQWEGAYSAGETFNYGWRDDKRTTAQEISVDMLPEHIAKMLEEDGMVFGIEIELPFKDLGVSHYKSTATDLRHPNSKYGRPLLSGCYDLMWEYDYCFSLLAKEMQTGRPISFIPTPLNGNQMLSQQMGDKELGNTYYQFKLEYPALFDDEFVKVPHTKVEDLMPSTVQFDIRSDKIKIAMESIATMIAHQVGISPTSLLNNLNQTKETKTATEVANDNSETNLTILRYRRLLQTAINSLIDNICYFYGKDGKDVLVTFPPFEELSKINTADYISKLRAVDGMSDETLVDLAYRDMSEAEKEEEVKRIQKLREDKNKQNEKKELNDFNNQQRIVNGKDVKKDENKVSK